MYDRAAIFAHCAQRNHSGAVAGNDLWGLSMRILPTGGAGLGLGAACLAGAD